MKQLPPYGNEIIELITKNPGINRAELIQKSKLRIGKIKKVLLLAEFTNIIYKNKGQKYTYFKS
jgi:hypothetical protein